MLEINVRLRGIGGLKVNEEIKIHINEELYIKDLLKKIIEEKHELSDFIDKNTLKPKPGIILLIENIDYNIVSNINIRELLGKNTEINITIIPVNHGG